MTTVVRCFVLVAVLVAALPELAVSQLSQREERIQVGVDPRVELMGIIFRLAGNPEYNMAPRYSYIANVEEKFRPFEGHAVIKTAQRLRNERGVSFDAVMSMALHVTDAIELEERVPFDLPPVKLDKRWPLEDARLFLEQARDFVEESGFEEFLQAHQAFYDEVASRLRERLSQRDYLAWFDEFFGARPKATFRSIPGLLNGGGNYGCSVVMPDGSEEIDTVLGVWDMDEQRKPRFGYGIVPTVVHEFCHSYVNAVVDRHVEELRPAGERIFPHGAAQMRQQAYGNWTTMMYESFVRVCVVRYLFATEGEAAGKQEIAEQHQRGFHWTGEFAALLDDYEANRDGYKGFDDFVPDIVDFFEAYAERNLPKEFKPALGPINAVSLSFRHAEKMLFVAPETVPDPAVAIDVEKFVKGIHAKFYAGSRVPLVWPSEVSEEGRRKALVLYGSPSSNALLKEVAEKSGFSITKEQIKIGGKTFQGLDLILITCYPNPFNPEVPVLLYTAADDRLAINLNSFMHGSTDYLIGKWGPDGKPVILHQGDYAKDSEGRWSIAD
ncbi:MAG: DUF4932 domain-containing protein [Planctomycetota bacterium]